MKNAHPSLRVATAALALAITSLSFAGDWPQWRGPARNGSAPEGGKLLTTMPAEGPPRLWHYPCPGGDEGGYGSVSVAGGRAYFYVCWRDKGSNKITDTYVCVDAATGKELWKAQFPGQYDGRGSSCTPCIADGRVYISGSAGKAYCLDAKDGSVVWQAKLHSVTNHSSFVVCDGLAVTGADNLTALDAKTGALAWENNTVRTHESSPVIWSHAGKNYVVCHGTNQNTICAELKTGATKWTIDCKGYSTVAIAEDTMVSFDGDGTRCFKLTPESASPLWTAAEFRNGGPSPIVNDGHVYGVGDRVMVCLNLADGKPVWQQKIPKCELSSPIYADGKVFVAVDSKVPAVKDAPPTKDLLVVFTAPDGSQQVSIAKLGILTFTSPSIADGRLYVRLGSGVACYRATSLQDGAP